MKQTTWFELAVSLSHCLGLHLYATNGAPSQTWGCLQPGRKVVTYLQKPTKLGNLRDVCDSITAPTAEPDLGFFSSVLRAESVEPTQGHQKCDRSVHRYTR